MTRIDGAKELSVEEKIWETIRANAKEVKYGNINITIHDGKITQVETRSKVRFN